MHDWNDDRIFQRACLGMARKGIEVHLIATKPEGLNPEKEFPNIKFHWLKKRSGLKRRIFSTLEALRICKITKVDFVIFHDPELLFFFRKPSNLINSKKYVFDMHENYSARFFQWFGSQALASFLSKHYQRIEKRKVNLLDGLLVVSESMRIHFASFSIPKIVVRNSIDLDRLVEIEKKFNQVENRLQVYTSGTNSSDRNVFETVKAFSLIHEKFPDLSLVFAGRYPGSTKEDLIDLGKGLGLSKKLEVEGMLPWDENFLRTKAGRIGCVFYAQNENNKVGLPNRIFEMMFCGLPIVVSDFPELRNIVEEGNCGVVVNSDDPQSIANGFELLLSNPEKADEMGKNGRTLLKTKYAYSYDLDRLIEFLNDL